MTQDDTPTIQERRQRRRAMAARQRRGVLWFLLASGVAALLVVVAALMRREAPPLMPPESPEETALQTSDENAFFVLQEAGALLPAAPPNVFARPQDDLGYVGMYSPEYRSLGDVLELARPDNDPGLLAYVVEARPAVAKMRDALALGTFRLPEPGSPENGGVYHIADLLARAATADAIYRSRLQPGDEAAAALLVDTMRLGKLLEQDGGLTAYRVAAMRQAVALSNSWEVASTFGPAGRSELLNQIESHSIADAPALHHLEYDWRIVDRPDAFEVLTGQAENERQPPDDPGEFIKRMFIGRELDRLRWHLHEYQERYQEGANLLPIPFDAWYGRHPEAFDRRRFLDPMQHLTAVADMRGRLTAWQRGWRIVDALERYKEAQGAYPESLDILEIDTTDPFTGQPYVYTIADGEYTLYSVGTNRADNGAYPWNDQDIVLRRASAEEEITAPPATLDMGQFRRNRRRE